MNGSDLSIPGFGAVLHIDFGVCGSFDTGFAHVNAGALDDLTDVEGILVVGHFGKIRA
ncbi:hypothetical protein OZX74_03365 [Bifidobacterium sp. ESL0798]|uniref:hypothetical protein n=1 Tax=Bifidobacterium sp. ESL0798 TaxID=2983235 RepID=UPI0023F80CE5|nr:hypothetical protein [Bifidobacterium sp. ESL0798]WEV74574.1 hypothetical protein OZX74_03365 [Bifidobacterium sp. ESL0798]